VYTGTHDNNTTRGWYEGLPNDQRQKLRRYLEIPDVEGAAVVDAMLRLVWSSAAGLALAPLQDLLNLGTEARMNVPGSAKGNWRWRSTKEMLSRKAFDRLRDLTRSCNRSAVDQSSPFSHETVRAGT
jgi:4-alpha-glucanotransferase